MTQTRFTIEIVMDNGVTQTPDDLAIILTSLAKDLKDGLEWDEERKMIYLFDRNHQRIGMAWLHQLG